MGIWPRVLLVQAVIAAVGVLVGTGLFRLKLRSTLLAIAFVLPTPLFKVSAGAAGFVFVSDLVAIGCIVLWLTRKITDDPEYSYRYSKFTTLCFVLLIVIPVISTAFGYVLSPSYRRFRYAVLGLSRGVGYYYIFKTMIVYARRQPRMSTFIALQCFVFAMVSVAGLAHFILGVDLDLWNSIREIEAGEYTKGFGTGFMGLYRGGVGAWSAVILGVTPIVFSGRRFGILWTTGILIVVFGATLAVGSRQGVVIGAAALLLGLWGRVRLKSGVGQLGAFLGGAFGLGVLLVVGLFAWSMASGDSFDQYLSSRFRPLLDPSHAVELAAQRDPRMGMAIENMKDNPEIMLFGVGYGTETKLFGARLVYVDSEALFMWQLGGFPMLLGYFLLLGLLWLRLRRQNWSPYDQERQIGSAALVALSVGAMLTYGHFFLLTTYSHQAPVAYWNWAMLGAGVSLCSLGEESEPYELDAGAGELESWDPQAY